MPRLPDDEYTMSDEIEETQFRLGLVPGFTVDVPAPRRAASSQLVEEFDDAAEPRVRETLVPPTRQARSAEDAERDRTIEASSPPAPLPLSEIPVLQM